MKTFILMLCVLFALSFNVLAQDLCSDVHKTINKVVKEGQVMNSPFGPNSGGRCISLTIQIKENVEARTYYVVYGSELGYEFHPWELHIINEIWTTSTDQSIISNERYQIHQKILIISVDGIIVKAIERVMVQSKNRELLSMDYKNLEENEPDKWLNLFINNLLSNTKA